jgi:hypothetical protein
MALQLCSPCNVVIRLMTATAHRLVSVNVVRICTMNLCPVVSRFSTPNSHTIPFRSSSTRSADTVVEGNSPPILSGFITLPSRMICSETSGVPQSSPARRAIPRIISVTKSSAAAIKALCVGVSSLHVIYYTLAISGSLATGRGVLLLQAKSSSEV